MNDLISRQAAIDAAMRDVSCIRTHEFNAGATRAANRIKQLPSTQPEQRWIPCNWHTEKENLPQECKSVLICMEGSYGYRIGVSYRADYNRWEGFGRVNVIAWMPLPEPYKAESEG